jgi:predicted RNase H-like HicB family nuclease
MGERVAYPLTFILKREGNQWASLAPELTVASCGDTMEAAREALEDAIQAYLSFLVSQGRRDEVWRPMSGAEVEDLKNDPPGEVRVESYAMILHLGPEGQEQEPEGVRAEFVPLVRHTHAVASA